MSMDDSAGECGSERPPNGTTDGRTERRTNAAPEVRMSEAAASAFLERRGWGCLSLADGGEAYSIPMSFGYDGDRTLYFQLQVDDDSRKVAFLDATTTATFLVTEVQPPEWTSVVVRGDVTRVPDEETDSAYAAVAENAWLPMRPWVPERDATELALYRLDADEISGRSSRVSD